ncbi:CheY chemotaxis protein or a CheY-like REC (receiver) domain [Algibacter pectinivorans]|uniref:CheY chemotaxis protein or a CheY-like REC (Receiver) domain n=2 Tax=Algibacter pectinivorans TaxID=870482 RepID=A0A1I1MGX5_9FLAO|nr:CheY chemotaxis protein or a CheY-like REC (receiver) domain [Algibacter pectinivorans]
MVLVDDSQRDLFITKHVVKKFDKNIRVVDFSSPITALEYLKISLHKNNLNYLTRPNVLIVDYDMPQCNGFEFLDKLRALEFLNIKDLKIYMLTSALNLIGINRAKANFCFLDYISKPLSLEDLHSISMDYQIALKTAN